MTPRQVSRVAVVIFKVVNGKEVEIFSCPQRDLFSKYRHPAKPKLIEAVKASL